MEQAKTDRRKSRTRRQLREALMGLILERGYSAVTIEDITQRADLGRTTFYLHYQDKEELLVESLDNIAADLKAQVELRSDGGLERARIRTNPVALAFNHAAENRDLYRIILKGDVGSTATSRMRDIIHDAALEYFSRWMGRKPVENQEIPTGVVAGYFASAMLGFITWWLEKELPYSGDEAAEMFIRLFFYGAGDALNWSLEN